MMTTPRSGIGLAFAFTSSLVIGCGASVPQATPGASAVTTGTDDPAAGLVEIGPIEASHGSGCGAFGAGGSYEGAYRVLRNRAAEMGATYVKILSEEPPHAAGGCFVNAYVIRGLAYRGEPRAEAETSGGASSSACSPPCSPGYLCEEGACIAVCNPPCSPGYTCASDRTCQPAPDAPTEQPGAQTPAQGQAAESP